MHPICPVRRLPPQSKAPDRSTLQAQALPVTAGTANGGRSVQPLRQDELFGRDETSITAGARWLAPLSGPIGTGRRSRQGTFMPRVRHVSVRNFRSIHALEWAPAPGINCLIGPGDSGKSTLLDAIDLCLGARRSVSFGDMDFYGLNVEAPISIKVTLGELPASLMDIDLYGDFLRGFDALTGAVDDEPRVGLETVLTLLLQIGADLEPSCGTRQSL